MLRRKALKNCPHACNHVKTVGCEHFSMLGLTKYLVAETYGLIYRHLSGQKFSSFIHSFIHSFEHCGNSTLHNSGNFQLIFTNEVSKLKLWPFPFNK